MKQLIRNLKAQWKTVIVSSHRLDALHEVCDTIYYLREGKGLLKKSNGLFCTKKRKRECFSSQITRIEKNGNSF